MDRQTLENYQAVINYWFPRLGYSCANEMVYPALGDRRAQASPEIERLRAMVRRLVDASAGYVWTSPDMAAALAAANALVPPLAICPGCDGTGKAPPLGTLPHCGLCGGTGENPDR